MQHFLAKFGLLPDQIETILKEATREEHPKGTRFAQPASSTNRIYYLHSGLTRSYRLLDGTDTTYRFYFPEEFCVDYYAYLTHTSTDIYLEALSDVVLYSFKKEDIETLFNQFKQLEHLGRIMAEKAFVNVSERFKSIQGEDLATRYTNFINSNPGLINAIPQRHIATYLATTPESLSRIKRKLQGR